MKSCCAAIRTHPRNTHAGSHIVLTLLLTRRYKVLSIDNSHNSYPEALKRACEIAKDELPADASEQDRDSAEIDIFTGDLTKPADVRRVFDKYGKGGIWGVIHVAVSVNVAFTQSVAF